MSAESDHPIYMNRFSAVDAQFHEAVQKIIATNPAAIDLIHQFPLYAGNVNLARYLALYEAFKKVANLNGHYADIGTWKGSSLLFIAKLIKLFEPYSYSQAHGFDWFQGMDPSSNAEGNYKGDYESLLELIAIQGLGDITQVHKLDLTTELKAFFDIDPYSGMRFKYIFLDCGIGSVLESALKHFWPRLCKGGILLFDHYGTSDCAIEAQVVDRFLKGQTMQSFSFARQPTAYVIKDT